MAPPTIVEGEVLEFLKQSSFPEKSYARHLPHHLLDLQSNAADMHCNIMSGDTLLKGSDEFNLKFSFETSPFASYIFLDLQLFPIVPSATTAESERNKRERVSVAFLTYEDNPSDSKGNASRQRYNYQSNWGNTQPRGPLHFSDQIRELSFTPGNHPSVPKAILHPDKYKPADQLHFSWRAMTCTQFSFGITNLSSAQQQIVNKFTALINHMIETKETLHVVTRPSSTIKEIFYPWFAAMPAPVLPSFFPWLNKLDKTNVQGVIKADSHGNPILEEVYVKEVLAVRPKGWVAGSLKGEYNIRALPSPYQMGHITAVTRFLDAREYLAHVVVGYLLEGLFSRRQRSSCADGLHSCQIIPQSTTSNLPRYIILLNIRVPALTESSRSQEQHGLPEVGERVTIDININKMDQVWTGTVQPMRAALSAEYAANTLIVASPPATTPETRHITINYLGSAYITFDHPGLPTGPTVQRITSLMLEDSKSKEDEFWRKVLLAQDNYNMSGTANVNYPSLPDTAIIEIKTTCRRRGLNAAQTRAVNHYFRHRLTIVCGPPGTGKSTLVDTIVELEHRFETTLWACADSDAAVNVLAHKACKRVALLHPGFYLRINQTFQEILSAKPDKTGNIAVIQPLLLESSLSSGTGLQQQIDDVFTQADTAKRVMSLENMIKHYMDDKTAAQLWPGMSNDLAKLKSALDRFTCLRYEPRDASEYDELHEQLEKEMLQELRKVQQECVSKSLVIFSTVSAASTPLLRKLEPKALVMDGASQTVEAKAVSAIIHALRAGKLERVLLIGDDQQLPPTVVSNENPFTPTMQVSLFERLIKSGFTCITLKEQFRMHPDISKTINSIVYSKLPGFSGLIDAPSTKAGPGIIRFKEFMRSLSTTARQPGLQLKQTLVISPVEDPEKTDWWKAKRLVGSCSRYNLTTARIVLRLIAALLSSTYRPQDIMVICFYADQVRLLKSVCDQISGLQKLRIMRVDTSQGSEADVVIVDCVVLGAGNGDGMGFLGQDQRRFNVAMSRAQNGRIVIAHKDMVPAATQTKTWKGFIEEATLEKVLMSGAFFNGPISDADMQAKAAKVFKNWVARSGGL